MQTVRLYACIGAMNTYKNPDAASSLLADFLLANGADVIVGSHPHVVQPAEISEEGRPVLYSLGNFISNQRKRYCDGGIIAEIDVVKRDSLPAEYRVTVTPVWVMLPGYRLVPPESADTVTMTPSQRAEYEIFMKDTELIFSRKGV